MNENAILNHIDFLEQHKGIWNHYKKDQTVPHIDYDVKFKLNEIHKEMYNGLEQGLYCSTCLGELLKAVYGPYDKLNQPTVSAVVDPNKVIKTEPVMIREDFKERKPKKR